MNQFINNLLNPPDSFEKKQIWYSDQAKRDFLIIENSENNYGLLKVVLVSRVTELEDSIDVILSKDRYEFLPSNRIALRFTKGPIHKDQLTNYLGSIDEETFLEINKALKAVSKNNYNEVEQRVLAEILDELEPIRQESIRLYEDSADSDTHIFTLPNVDSTDVEGESEHYYSGKLAADDITATQEEYNFWELEESGEGLSKTIITEDSILLKLSIIDNNIYLVIYANQPCTLEGVSVKQDAKVIVSEPNKIVLKEPGRAALFFDKTKIVSGSAELIFTLNDVNKRETVRFD